MSSPSGATPAIGTSLFDAEGPGGAVENVTGAAAGTANAGSDGLFGTSPHLSAMVGAGGLFDSDSGPSQSLLDGPAPAVAAPMVLANDDVSGAAMDADLAELRKTYEESNSLFASMGVDGGQRSPSKPRSAHTDAAAAGAGDAPVPPPPAEEIGGEATAGSGAPAPQLSGDQAHDDEVGQGGAAPAVSSRRWQGRGGSGLFDADGDATDVYAEGGGSAHALGFSGSIAATTKEQLLEMVAALRPRVAELEAELKETNAKLRQSREENAHLRAENSKLRIRYHTRPGVTGDFDLTPPPPPSPLARRASGRRPSGKPELVTDGSHPLGHRPASGQMFLPDDWDSDTAGAATRTAGGGQPRRGGAGGGAAASGGGQAQQEAQSAAALFSPMHGAGGAAANTPRSQGLDPTWGSSSASYLRTAGSAATRRVANGQGMKLPRRASDVAALFGSPGGTSPASSAKAPSGLFAGLGDVSATRAGRSHSTASTQGGANPELFQAFMATPDAGQLNKAVSQFMKRTTTALDAGSSPAEIGASVTEFMEGAVNWLYDRPLFKTANDATVEYARDQLEKEIMVKLHPRVFVASPEEAAEDAAFYERCKRLQFLTADMLDVPPGCNNEMVMRLAQDELARINSHTTPQAKLECIVACADILFRSLNLSRGADASRPGADEFLPVFIYVVLRANVRQVLANATYIDRFRYPGGLMSKSGYCFANFQSALQFLQRLDHTSVKGCDEATFRAHISGKVSSPPADAASGSLQAES